MMPSFTAHCLIYVPLIYSLLPLGKYSNACIMYLINKIDDDDLNKRKKTTSRMCTRSRNCLRIKDHQRCARATKQMNERASEMPSIRIMCITGFVNQIFHRICTTTLNKRTLCAKNYELSCSVVLFELQGEMHSRSSLNIESLSS